MASYRSSQENEYTVFNDPAGYIKEIFHDSPESASQNSTSSFLLKCLAKFYEGLDRSDGSLKILDYGCGPSLPYSISAASKASEIVLADYNKWNREYLQDWVNGEPSAHNWTPYFKYVVQHLEGRSDTEAEERETDLRKKIKVVTACDITKSELIDSPFKVEYDVVMNFLSIENVARDFDGYRSCIIKLSSLVKGGGHLLLLCSWQESAQGGFYVISGVRFQHVSLRRDFVLEAIKEAGFVIGMTEYLPLQVHSESSCDGMMFVSARKFHRAQ